MSESCETCRFWKEIPESRPWARSQYGEPHLGNCRKTAPTVNKGFPKTSPSNWCGEYAAKDAPEHDTDSLRARGWTV